MKISWRFFRRFILRYIVAGIVMFLVFYYMQIFVELLEDDEQVEREGEDRLKTLSESPIQKNEGDKRDVDDIQIVESDELGGETETKENVKISVTRSAEQSDNFVESIKPTRPSFLISSYDENSDGDAQEVGDQIRGKVKQKGRVGIESGHGGPPIYARKNAGAVELLKFSSKEWVKRDDILQMQPTQPGEDITSELPKPFADIYKKKNKYSPKYKSSCFYFRERFLCLPYFYCLGPQKTGTSELFEKLTLHPELIRTEKEIHYWTRTSNFNNTIAALGYLNYFKEASKEIVEHPNKIFGDGSPTTLWDLRCSYCIQKGEPRKFLAHQLLNAVQPDAKFIVMLRNPADRLYSSYKFFRFETDDPLKSPDHFHEMVERKIEDLKRCDEGPYFSDDCTLDVYFNAKHLPGHLIRLNMGMYSFFLKMYLQLFKKEQFLVFPSEMMLKGRDVVLQKCYEFLDVQVLNSTSIQKMIKESDRSRVKNRSPYFPPMLPETRQLLDDFYAPYTKELLTLFPDFDISYWNTPKKPAPNEEEIED